MAVYLGSPDLGKKIREDASAGAKERMQEGMVAWGEKARGAFARPEALGAEAGSHKFATANYA